MRECLCFPCLRNTNPEKVLSTLQKKQYIVHFLREVAQETENEVDDFVVEFVQSKLK